MRLIPAGFSKVKQKPYKAFWVCDSCGKKTFAGENAIHQESFVKKEEKFNQDLKQGSIEKMHDEKQTAISRMNALTNAVKFYEGKNVDELVIFQTAETFYKWITDEDYLGEVKSPFANDVRTTKTAEIPEF
ncbi:MAG: hypothetical protein WC549_04580 [Actinomycetota bacterium]